MNTFEFIKRNIYKFEDKFGFYDEAGIPDGRLFDSELECAFQLGKYCHQLSASLPNSPAMPNLPVKD